MKACAKPRVKGPNKGTPATGTRTGYDRHLAAKEKPCDACRRAQLDRFNAWKATQKKPPKPKPKRDLSLPTPRHEPAFVGSEFVRCACGARGRANKALLKRGQRKLESCVECR